jgi:hypothetical protein
MPNGRLPLGTLIAHLNGNKTLYETGERPRGPELSIHYRYTVGYLENANHQGLESPANEVHGLPLYVLERFNLAGFS